MLEERGLLDRAQLGAVAGLSLGEYTAHYVAGTFAFEEKRIRRRFSRREDLAVRSIARSIAVRRSCGPRCQAAPTRRAQRCA